MMLDDASPGPFRSAVHVVVDDVELPRDVLAHDAVDEELEVGVLCEDVADVRVREAEHLAVVDGIKSHLNQNKKAGAQFNRLKKILVAIDR